MTLRCSSPILTPDPRLISLATRQAADLVSQSQYTVSADFVAIGVSRPFHLVTMAEQDFL
jgi:hypothetical protein